MPESESQAASRQRRANWVALRTLRQLPKPAGETADGEPVYKIRSVRLLLHGVGANFVRLTECARCGREQPGAPVLTPADLDRPLRPMICADCIRKAGVSTMWEPESEEPERPAPAAPAPAVAAPAPPAPVAAPEAPAPAPAPAPEPPGEAAGEAKPARLDVLEGHLRVVTDRINELGRVARAHQADLKDRDRREEAAAATLRDQLAALQAATEETRAEVGRVAEAERSRGEGAPPAGAGPLGEALARLAQQVEEQQAALAQVATNLDETQRGHAQLALACQVLDGRLGETAAAVAGHVDRDLVEELVARRVAEAEARTAEAVAAADTAALRTVEGLVASRLAESERRLTQVIAAQRADLQGTAKELRAAVAGIREELAAGQAALGKRIEALAGQLAQASGRTADLLDRLEALEAVASSALAVPEALPDDVPVGSLLDSLDRQLEAAARRLAARARTGAGRVES